MPPPRARLVVLAAALAAAAAWTAAAALAPWIEARGLPGGGAIRAAAAHVCHQNPERSLSLAGSPMAVCARCLGLYAGGVAGLAASLLAGIHRRPWRRRGTLLLLSALPTAIDVALTLAAGWGTSTAWRPLPGLPLGFVSAVFLSAALDDLAGGAWSQTRWTSGLPTSSARP